MSVDLSHIKRYELKYRVTEDQAQAIKSYIQGICVPDRHTDPKLGGYIVNNLYFDTPDMRFYYDTKHRKLTRFKPRARYYGHRPQGYIWPEIKYRSSNVIWKKRDCVTTEEWPGLFYPRQSDSKDMIIHQQIETFQDVIQFFGAKPVLHVRYFREPFVTELESYGRVTFDRDLSCRAADDSVDMTGESDDLMYYDDAETCRHPFSPVILEIKVETAVPQWAIDLIRTFNLMQSGFSKYCYGIEFLKSFSSAFRHPSAQLF